MHFVGTLCQEICTIEYDVAPPPSPRSLTFGTGSKGTDLCASLHSNLNWINKLRWNSNALP